MYGITWGYAGKRGQKTGEIYMAAPHANLFLVNFVVFLRRTHGVNLLPFFSPQNH
jgi:hypothetical protein